jgi:hypothetical protein
LTLRVLALTAGASEVGSTAAYKDHDDGGVSVWDPVKGLSRRSILDRIELSNFQSSTKIEALMEVCCMRSLLLGCVVHGFVCGRW